ncbi:hypothetical protein ZWY2020_007138 [Hordeum vulgare]|nr:hypothetical protein ZWY2020_007138 [Hordeum vulgare]
MDSARSCLADDASSGGSTGKKASPAPPAPTTKLLQRVGSGASMVMDAPETARRRTPAAAGGCRRPSTRDAAAQRFRGRDAVTNFRPLAESDPDDAAELRFLAARSKADVVDLLRKHTYPDELTQQKRAYFATAAASSPTPSSLAPAWSPSSGAAPSPAARRVHLFDKTVTPSDVGKLNRLVIPKQHAEKHFPLQLRSAGAAVSGECKGMLLNFDDAAGKVWRFRYSYWNNNQSYVLTKGWSRFVKEKGLHGELVGRRLQAGDGLGGAAEEELGGLGVEEKKVFFWLSGPGGERESVFP